MIDRELWIGYSSSFAFNTSCALTKPLESTHIQISPSKCMYTVFHQYEKKTFLIESHSQAGFVVRVQCFVSSPFISVSLAAYPTSEMGFVSFAPVYSDLLVIVLDRHLFGSRYEHMCLLQLNSNWNDILFACFLSLCLFQFKLSLMACHKVERKNTIDHLFLFSPCRSLCHPDCVHEP